VDVAGYVARSSAAQGLGPTVTDPATLHRVAAILAAPTTPAEGRQEAEQ
jgi:hypothetical protein